MIEIKNLKKSFSKKELFFIDKLILPSTGIIVVKGENGCGKTTLFNILSLIDNNYDGSIEIDRVDFKKASDQERSLFRSKNISYVFQKNNLLSFLDSRDNEFIYENKKTYKNINKISQFSQGQQELIALRRSLQRKAKIYLLDEVLSSLDEKNRLIIKEKIVKLSKESLILLVSHDVLLEEIANAVYEMKDGRLIEQKKVIKEDIKSNSENKNLPDYTFLRKKCRHSFLGLHFLNFLSCIILFGLLFMGITAVRDDSLFLLASSLENDKPVYLSSNQYIDSNEVLKKYDSFTYLSIDGNFPLGIAENISCDKKIHCQQKTIQDYASQAFVSSNQFILSNDVKIPLQIDENVPRGVFLTNQKTLDEYKYEYYRIRLLNFWGTKKYSSKEMKEKYDNSYIWLINETYYQKKYNEDVPFEILADIFYSSTETFESANIQHFETQVSQDSFQPDFNELFTSGSKCIYNKDLKSSEFEILVSDATFKKIKSTYQNHQKIIFVTNNHHFQIASFFYFNKLKIGYYFSETAGIKRYNEINGSLNKTNNYTYSFLTVSATILYLLLESGLFYYIIYVSKKDIRVLYGIGFSKNEIFDMLFSPFVITMLLSIIFGTIFSIIVFLVGQSGFMTSFLFSTPIILILFIIEFLFNNIIFRSILKNEN